VRVLAIANAKGGVGKTTTALTLAAALAESAEGSQVLLIDLDPGGGLGSMLRQKADGPATSACRLLMPPQVDLNTLVHETLIPGVRVIPSHPAMAMLDAQLSTTVEREFLLRRALHPLRQQPSGQAAYSWVILDVGPYMGILSINALTAADAVVLPLPPEYAVLAGGKMLLEYVERVRDRLNPDLRILGILPTMVDSRTRHARDMLEQLRAVFGELLFDEAIPYTVRLKEAPILGASILTYDPGSRAAYAYRQLAEEVQARCLASV